jgi:hypothetical protein
VPEVAVITTIDCPCGVACGDEPLLEQPAMNPAPATNTIISKRKNFSPLPPNRRRQTATKDANGNSTADVIAAT